MAKQPNMKIGIGADTKDFEKGAKQVKQGLKDLSKTGNDALSSLGNAFGINTGKVGQFASAVVGLGQKMSECGSSGVAAFGNILKSVGPVGVAIAGLGISAAIASFRELNKEADAFKNTVQGANIEMATATYVDTYRQVLRDFNGDTAQALANTQSSWKKFWGEFKSIVSDYFVSGKVFNPAGRAASSAEQYRAAGEAAERAEQITNQIYDLERKRKEQAIDLAKLNNDIADQMLIAKDTSESTENRQAAIAKIEADLVQKKSMTVSLDRQIADLYKERSSLASDSVEAADKTIAMETRAYETERAITQEETALLRVKNSIGRASDAEIKRMNELIRKQKELQAAVDAVKTKWAGMNEGIAGLAGVNTPEFSGVLTPKLSVLPMVENKDYFTDVLNAQLGDVTIGVGLKVDEKQIHDITNEVNSLLESSVVRTGEIIGNLVGTLAGGGDAWGDFKNAALSAFGDMAIAVGKIAIQVGLADAGIEAALSSGQWYLAVAAGAALVALGSAVKSSLSAVASGDYSAAGGGYSGSYSGGSSGGGFETREVTVNVTGTLEADGDKLITVINNTNRKNYYTK